MLKLFPSVCASQILWEYTPNCWTTPAEIVAAELSQLHEWAANTND